MRFCVCAEISVQETPSVDQCVRFGPFCKGNVREVRTACLRWPEWMVALLQRLATSAIRSRSALQLNIIYSEMEFVDTSLTTKTRVFCSMLFTVPSPGRFLRSVGGSVTFWCGSGCADPYLWQRIRLLSSVTWRMQKKCFNIFFSYNLPAGTLSSVLKFKFFAKILC